MDIQTAVGIVNWLVLALLSLLAMALSGLKACHIRVTSVGHRPVEVLHRVTM